MRRRQVYNEVAWEKVLEALESEHQVMVFMHARNDTVQTARYFMESSMADQKTHLLVEPEDPRYGALKNRVKRVRFRTSSSLGVMMGSIVDVMMIMLCVIPSLFLFLVCSCFLLQLRSADLKELFPAGLGFHHSGMLRQDREFVEQQFAAGLIRVLCTTATLAWGVNLPAHTVIIKGTQLYNPKAGGFVELSMLDVMQIFGRAGRPQFDSSGEGIIITSRKELPHYLDLLNQQLPIESQFETALPNHLNAEVILGTVTNMQEAVRWLSYTYLFTRMMRNPTRYGISFETRAVDAQLVEHRKMLIRRAAETLMRCRMVKFDLKSGNFYSTVSCFTPTREDEQTASVPEWFGIIVCIFDHHISWRLLVCVFRISAVWLRITTSITRAWKSTTRN